MFYISICMYEMHEISVYATLLHKSSSPGDVCLGLVMWGLGNAWVNRTGMFLSCYVCYGFHCYIVTFCCSVNVGVNFAGIRNITCHCK